MRVTNNSPLTLYLNIGKHKWLHPGQTVVLDEQYRELVAGDKNLTVTSPPAKKSPVSTPKKPAAKKTTTTAKKTTTTAKKTTAKKTTTTEPKE